MRLERRKSVLQFSPRFPLYGGWKTSWFYGYTVPQGQMLDKVSKNSEDYRLKVSLVPTLSGLAIEKAKLKIVLPEGAEYII